MPLHNAHPDASEDYSRCPLPKTHRRLGEAHLLWHQALAQYQDPGAFQANLNATIQALRNVTFILQSEKHALSDFDEWYSPWQERLRADPICKWLVDARNIIVKQGELQTNSTAVVKLVTWRDDVLAESAFPPDAPPSLILSNLPIIELTAKAGIPAGDVKSAAVLIERRWCVAGLGDHEVLEALAQAYGVLSELVLDAHLHVRASDCIPADRARLHFLSTHDRTGTLQCMAIGVESRTHRFELATGRQLAIQGRMPIALDPAIIAARYRFGENDQIAKWEGTDPLVLADRIVYTAKRMLSKDKGHIRVMFIREGNGTWRMLTLSASNRTEKHLLIRMVARLVESIGGDAVIDVSEIWVVKGKAVSKIDDLDRIQEVPGRGEALQVTVATREGVLRTYTTAFTRGPFGGIKLSDTRQHGRDEYTPYYLEPIFDVWRRQGFSALPDGRQMPRLWEPDPLDICLCGGPKRFANCCRRILEPKADILSIKRDLDAATAGRNFARTEELARATLAQYVIWVRQHTPFARQAGDVYRELLEIDASALESLVLRLRDSLEANGHLDSFVPQLRHISEVVGVPELSVRLIALAAQWLFESGDLERAAKELEILGNFERVRDSLALLLATKTFDLPAHKQQQFLSRAVDNAFTKEEKWFSGITLARCLLVSGKRDEALRIAASVKSESMDANPDALCDALSLVWEITEQEEDFRAAKNEMEKFVDTDRRQKRLASLLIDHGNFDEAERVLAKALDTADPVAQLLAIDARLRAGRVDAARELLLSVDRERVTPRLQYPYAYTYALVALTRDEVELKRLAVSYLRRLPVARSLKHVKEILKALESGDSSRPKSFVASIREFLAH